MPKPGGVLRVFVSDTPIYLNAVCSSSLSFQLVIMMISPDIAMTMFINTWLESAAKAKYSNAPYHGITTPTQPCINNTESQSQCRWLYCESINV